MRTATEPYVQIEGATGVRAEGVSLLPPGNAPFRGLRFFDVEDSLLFFGRDAEIQDLLDKLKADSFLAVVGDSGSGKSSLVRAGLIPALHRGRFHDGNGWVESWRVAIVRPGEDPFGELAEGLCDLDPQMSSADKAAFLKNRKEDLSTTKDGLRNAIAALVPRGTRSAPGRGKKRGRGRSRKRDGRSRARGAHPRVAETASVAGGKSRGASL